MKRKAKPQQPINTALKVESWPLARIKPYAGNARKNDATVDKVVESIKAFGFRQPIVVDAKGVIVVGHTRFEAARRLRMASAPVTVMRDRTSAEIAAYRLMDNRSHEDTTWDEELLSKEIASLIEAGADPKSTGFEDDELARLVGEIEPAAIAEPPASVQANIDRLERVRTNRAKGNSGVIEKSDTEHYLVIVYPDRRSRENAAKRLGLPADERYIDSAGVELKVRVGGARELRVTAERSTAAAPAKRAGATG